MPYDFSVRNIYSKVNRANRHIDELHGVIRRYIDTSLSSLV
jgi:hypothetical protein